MLQIDHRTARSRQARSHSTGTASTEVDSERQGVRRRRPQSSVPHPVIYKAIAGLVLWFVVSARLFFGSAPHMGLILAVVTALFIMATGVPYVLWRVGEVARRQQPQSADEPAEPFRAWLGSDFTTWTGNQTSATAAVEIVLPIAAVAIGIMALGIVWATAS